MTGTPPVTKGAHIRRLFLANGCKLQREVGRYAEKVAVEIKAAIWVVPQENDRSCPIVGQERFFIYFSEQEHL